METLDLGHRETKGHTEVLNAGLKFKPLRMEDPLVEQGNKLVNAKSIPLLSEDVVGATEKTIGIPCEDATKDNRHCPDFLPKDKIHASYDPPNPSVPRPSSWGR